MTKSKYLFILSKYIGFGFLTLKKQSCFGIKSTLTLWSLLFGKNWKILRFNKAKGTLQKSDSKKELTVITSLWKASVVQYRKASRCQDFVE